MELIPQAPAEILATASPAECRPLLWSVPILNDDNRIICKDPQANTSRGSVDQAAAVKQRGDGEPKDGGEV